MGEYIEKEALIEEFERIYHAHYVKAREQSIHDVFKAVFKRLSNAPAADVVEVVRCKDCKSFNGDDKFCKAWEAFVRETDFCSYGERRESDETD